MSSTNEVELAIVLFDFSPEPGSKIKNAISLNKNDEVKILKKRKNGWFTVQGAGKKGVFPSNYLKILSKDVVMLKKKRAALGLTAQPPSRMSIHIAANERVRQGVWRR
eukprot:TRINITY_DN7610_c0_g2_i1.p3 TRINITY_DN7610_c0_g2~~TRINITY_DN7610_c0_g2_i1.p3  ORF type:complete len:108 (+),score=28.72 TRINITY_DN7610_c0_g2_i1:67-390(+)